MRILITGAAGFIGFHLSQQLLSRGDDVIGIDNINDYYDINLKFGRLKEVGIPESEIHYNKPVKSFRYTNYTFLKLDLEDADNLSKLFDNSKFDIVCNLAAQAGVRYSLTNPQAYINSNIQGFLNLLECCRTANIKHLIYASSSSVYGLNDKMPFSVKQQVDQPISLYAATKKSNELMAHTYSHLYGIPTTGLRFFTVYGPWGRPDMALFLFTEAILASKPIKVFNNGEMKRDFTYIDDIVSGILKIIDRDVSKVLVLSQAPYQIFNIGKGRPVALLDFVSAIETNLGLTAIKDMVPLQDGDVAETWADISDLEAKFGFKPRVDVDEGVRKFIEWYKGYYLDADNTD